MFRLFSLRTLKNKKMEKEQREKELVYEEMVRKYVIIVYLHLDTLFILFIIVTRNETISYKNNIFNIITTLLTILYQIIFSIRNINSSLLLRFPNL